MPSTLSRGRRGAAGLARGASPGAPPLSLGSARVDGGLHQRQSDRVGSGPSLADAPPAPRAG